MRRKTIDTVIAVRHGAETVHIFIPPGEVVEVEPDSTVLWRGQRLLAKGDSIQRATRDEQLSVDRTYKGR